MRILWYAAYVAGIGLSGGGVCCSLVAYSRTFKLHGKTELFPRLAVARRRTVGFLARFLPFLRKDGTVTVVPGSVAFGVGMNMSASGTVAIPADGTVEERIAAITKAVEHLEDAVIAERGARKDAVAAVELRLGEMSTKFAQAVDDLDAKLYDVGVDSLRLQILGVALVIPGTTLLAVLSLFPPPLP